MTDNLDPPDGFVLHTPEDHGHTVAVDLPPYPIDATVGRDNLDSHQQPGGSSTDPAQRLLESRQRLVNSIVSAQVDSVASQRAAVGPAPTPTVTLAPDDPTPPDDPSDLSAAERADLDDLIPPLPDILHTPTPADAGDPASAQYRAVVRAAGRLSERTLDAMARQLATGIPLRTVSAYFGLEVRKIQYLLGRSDFSRRVAHYGARMEAQSAMNLSRLFLEADRVIDNVMAQASNPDAKYFMECTKLVWNQVLPTRAQSEQKIEVSHRLDVASAMALSDSIQDLKRTIPHRASINPAHVTRGSAGVPSFHVTPDGDGE